MLVREGDQRTIRIDTRLAALLAAIAGALNAAGFQATGLFSANMTGNVSALSDHIGVLHLGLAAFFGTLVVLFTAGAFVSGLLIEAGRQKGVKAIYAYSITLEAFLLFALGATDIILSSSRSATIIIFGLSFVMGLQNAATTRISNARVRTTHVSGMATDIGLGLAALVNHSSHQNEAVVRLQLHLSAVAAFLAGGIVGVIIYLAIGGWLLLLCGTVLCFISLPEAQRARHNRD